MAPAKKLTPEEAYAKLREIESILKEIAANLDYPLYVCPHCGSVRVGHINHRVLAHPILADKSGEGTFSENDLECCECHESYYIGWLIETRPKEVN